MYSQKYMDAFASALGFFLVGFHASGSKSQQCLSYRFFDISDPVMWFFKVNMLLAQLTITLATVHLC